MRNDTVAVRDRRNPERLLGHLMRRPCTLRGPFVEMAVMPSLHELDLARPHSVANDIQRVRFEASWRTSADGYEKTAEFLTDAPLDVLARLDLFVTLGESEADAFRRRRYA